MVSIAYYCSPKFAVKRMGGDRVPALSEEFSLVSSVSTHAPPNGNMFFRELNRLEDFQPTHTKDFTSLWSAGVQGFCRCFFL